MAAKSSQPAIVGIKPLIAFFSPAWRPVGHPWRHQGVVKRALREVVSGSYIPAASRLNHRFPKISVLQVHLQDELALESGYFVVRARGKTPIAVDPILAAWYTRH